MKPINDQVVVVRNERAQLTPGWLHISEAAKEKAVSGTVVAVGPGRTTDDGVLVPCSIEQGDVVYFGKYAGVEVEIEDA